MIKIEHIAMWTPDLQRLADFYARYFAATVGEEYVNPRKGFSSRFLRFGSGARLELMSTTQLAPVLHEAGAQRMGLTHLALALGNKEAVDALTAQLQQDGYTIADAARTTGDGYYESVVLDPDGNRIEITM